MIITWKGASVSYKKNTGPQSKKNHQILKLLVSQSLSSALLETKWGVINVLKGQLRCLTSS